MNRNPDPNPAAAAISIVEIGAGSDHTLARASDGRVYAFRLGGQGEETQGREGGDEYPGGVGGGEAGASPATARHKHSTPFVMPNPPMADTASSY